MKFAIALCLLGSALAAPQSYPYPPQGEGYYPPGYGTGPCPTGQIRNVLGICVDAIFSQNTFVYQGPALTSVPGPLPDIPAPRVDYDVVFVRTPEQQDGGEPIVIPPPEKRTIVYVLTKNGSGQQQVIEVPALPGQAPEVFYVNYNDGDNPELAGGVKLLDILEQAALQGGAIGDGGFGAGAGADAGFGGAGVGGGQGGAGGQGQYPPVYGR